MKAVNALILSRMQSSVPLIPELAGHLIAAGGKRIRPLLTIATANMFGYQGTRHHMLSACVEFIHTATLLHDDVVDDSDTRRGRPSANAVFGNEASVLVGDFLFSRAFELMVEDGSLDVLGVLSKASAVIAEGEVLQLATTGNVNTSFDEYMDVIRSKTAVLFAAACETGALVSDVPEDVRSALRDYGMHLGIAFQMADDILDYESSTDAIGKVAGDDFREGKLTLPVVLALAKADADEKSFWTRTLTHGGGNDADFETAKSILRKHDIFTEARDVADDHVKSAQACLAKASSVCKNPEMAELMSQIAAFSVSRAF